MHPEQQLNLIQNPNDCTLLIKFSSVNCDTKKKNENMKNNIEHFDATGNYDTYWVGMVM